jgi:hypothetical protein
MNQLYECSVPVLSHYLTRLWDLYDTLEEQDADPNLRLMPDGFSAGRHFSVAQGFGLRAVFPALGKPIPELPSEETQFEDLRLCNRFVRKHLSAISRGDFEKSTLRNLRHVAGQANVSQSVQDYVLLFGMPNFFFHIVTGHATFRRAGFDLGKSDFDGIHSYEKDFSFM